MPSHIREEQKTKVKDNLSVMSNSEQTHGLLLARLLCPWDSLGKKIGVGSYSLLQAIFLAEGSNLGQKINIHQLSLPHASPRTYSNIDHTVMSNS